MNDLYSESVGKGSLKVTNGCQLRKQHRDWYGDFSANTNMELVNRNDTEIEGNDVEMN